MNSHKFNKDYYEDGIRQHLSGYQEYKWMPTRSIPEAIDIKNNFTFDTCVDYGCAKGFLVHALRILGVEAYGEDISEYAISNCHPKVSEFISLPNDKKYDLLIAKDILEHVEEQNIPPLLNSFINKANQFFFVIPLGDDNMFRIREYEVDVTHVTKKDEEWWINIFSNNGIKITKFSYSFGSIKNKWIINYPYGNGFFVGEKK
jgi:predicted TPR repeat methyltransferase